MLCGLALLSPFAWPQSRADNLQLQDGGLLLLQAGGAGLPGAWSLRLPNPAKDILAVRDDFVLIRDEHRLRFISGGSAGSGEPAWLRTIPSQLQRGTFSAVTADGMLILTAGAQREKIDIPLLLLGVFRSEISGGPRGNFLVHEPMVTPKASLFWKPVRPAGQVGPGQGTRAEIIAAFSQPRANEKIIEHDSADCSLPGHTTQKQGLLIPGPTQTKVYEHHLRDRKGNELRFFTATGSGDVSYLSVAEATIRGCEATYLRYRGLAPSSFDVTRKLGEREFLVRVELRDGGLPAAGVRVRDSEQMDQDQELPCQPLVGRPTEALVDGLTLPDGSFAWNVTRVPRIFGSRARRGTNYYFDRDAVAKLCIQVDDKWFQLWRSPSESRGYYIRCDLARPAAQRCERVD